MYSLGLFEALFAELESFGNVESPELFYEFYPDTYAGYTGSMLPFGVRLLRAIVPYHVGKIELALDRLYQLHGVCVRLHADLPNLPALPTALPTDRDLVEARVLWRRRIRTVLASIANVCIGAQDYALALGVLERLLQDCDPTVPSERDHVLSSLGRVRLLYGDLSGAQRHFDDMSDSTSLLASMNQALATMASGKFGPAGALFDKLANTVTDAAIDAATDAATDTSASSNSNSTCNASRTTTSINNHAVCQLYAGAMDTALASLEALPSEQLADTVCGNIAVLFELESSHALDRKHALLARVAHACPDAFDVAPMKIPL